MSDHLPLQCTIQVNLSRAIQKPVSINKLQRVRWGKINKEEYETRVTDRLSSVEGGADSINCLDSKIQKLNEILVKEAVDLLPSRPKMKKTPNSWYGIWKSSKPFIKRRKHFGTGKWTTDHRTETTVSS